MMRQVELVTIAPPYEGTSATVHGQSNLACAGKVAMSLIILITAVLGFNSLTGTEVVNNVVPSSSRLNSSDFANIDSESSNVVAPAKKTNNSTQIESKQELIDELEFAKAEYLFPCFNLNELLFFLLLNLQ